MTMNISNVDGFTESDVTWDRILHDSGYETHYYGKWHLEFKGKLPSYYPESYRYEHEWLQEMQEVFADVRKGDPWTYMDHYGLILPVEIEPGCLKTAQAVSGRWKTEARPPFYELALKIGRLKLKHEQHPDVRVVDHAVSKLGSLPKDKPFSLTCSIQAPHDPNVIHSPYYEMFDPSRIELPANRDFRERRFDEGGWRYPARKIVADLGERFLREFTRIYYASVKMIDDEVGRILRALENTGRADNTIVIFTADHGDMLGGHGMATKSVDAFYDEIAVVPLIIQYPRRIQPQKVTGSACLTDVMPTVLEFCGKPIPGPVQGTSLARMLMGQPSPADSRRFAFCERVANSRDGSRRVQPGTAAHFMIRGHGWKYVRYNGGDEQLFHLEHDPLETRNLAADPKYADTRARLATEIDYWLRRTGFPESQPA